MKLSLIAASTIALLSAACGTSDKADAQEPAPPAQPASEEPAPAPQRQLVEGKVFATSPTNLIVDPGFALAGSQQAGYGSFLAFYEGGFDPYEITTTLDSRSPAGFGLGIAKVEPSGATDTKSEPVMILTSFLGGQGPFHAQVWVSKSTVKGEPTDFPTEGRNVFTALIADGDPDTGEAFDLKPVDGASRTVAGRTWVLLRADITKPLTSGGFFVMHTGQKGGFFRIAAPEVVTDQIVVGQAVMRSSLNVASPRAKSSIERAAIAKYRSLPPRLVPASPKPSFTR